MHSLQNYREDPSPIPVKEDGYAFDAFLSYSRRDSNPVRELVSRLTAKEVSAWLDQEQIDVGDPITEKLQKGLQNSRYLIVCLTKNFKNSEWCKREYHLHLAREIHERTVRVLPVRLDDYTEEDIPDFLFDKYAVDARTEDGIERLVRKVKTRLKGVSQGPSTTNSSQQPVTNTAPSGPTEDAESEVQLSLPHEIARSYFTVLQEEDPGKRSLAIERCFDITLQTVTALCLADHAAHSRLPMLQPILANLHRRSRVEKIEALSAMVSATQGEARTTFIPHLPEWATESDGQPTGNFVLLFRLALALNGPNGNPSASKLLRSLLESLLWLRLYRIIEIGHCEQLGNSASGSLRTLTGAIRGFRPEPFQWQIGTGGRLERGCYLENPERNGLLYLSPFFLTRPRRSESDDHEGNYMFVGLEGESLIVQGINGDQHNSGLGLPTEHVGQKAIKYFFIQPVDTRATEQEVKEENEEHPAEGDDPEVENTEYYDLKALLLTLQKSLLKAGEFSRLPDRLLVELDTIGTRLVDGLTEFPDHAEDFQELSIEWSRRLDKALEFLSSEEERFVLLNRRREVEVALEDLLGGFSRSQALFMNGERHKEDSPYKPASVIRDSEYGLRLLLSRDDLEQSDGIHWLLAQGFERCSELLTEAQRTDRGDAVLGVVWRRFARIFLYYRDLFWDLAKLMLKADSSRWRPKLDALRVIFSRDLTVELAQSILTDSEIADQPVLASFLTIHPRHGCREIGRKSLKPSDRWEILLAPSVHSTIMTELINECCKDCSPSFVKAMFLLVRSRLKGAKTPIALNHSFEALKSFYETPLFLEAAFFKALLTLHQDLNKKAQSDNDTSDIGKNFEWYFEDFRKCIASRDNEITEMNHIPLPIQRKLARDGHFVEIFICNSRDPIALESVPHALRRSDVIRFFKSSLVNRAALFRMAEDRQLMREYSLKVALCKNPKADPKQVRNYLPHLSVTDLRLISEDKNVSQFARTFAKQLLALKT